MKIIKTIYALRSLLSNMLWRSAYAMEEARQDYAAAGYLWRQAGCCIALSLFRMIGGRGV